MNTKRLADYIKRNGLSSTYYAVRQHLSDNAADREYDRQVKTRVRDEAELVRQRTARFDYAPLISILVPTYKPEDKYFREMLRSVKAQTYGRYELLLGNGGGISDNTNAALSEAKGDYIALLDQDDFIEPDALYYIVEAINRGARLIYTDEDKYDSENGRYLRPFRKRDFDMELVLSNNYVCHFLVAEKALAMDIGGFRSEYDGAQDHDFILRCSERLKRQEIAHVPHILYHWRIHEGSTAGDPSVKDYAHLAGKRAIEDYLRRNGKHGKVTETEHRGFYRVEYKALDDEGSGLADAETDDARSAGVPYTVHLGGGIVPARGGYETQIGAYLAENKDVGAVGGRVIDKLGHIVSSGYERDGNGDIVSLYHGMNHRLAGEFNMASLRQEVDIISNQCIMLRSGLGDCYDSDSGRMSEKIKAKGYRIILDPKLIYIKK